MLHMGPCDIKGIGHNIIAASVCKQPALAAADIMNLVAAAAVAVGGNRRCQLLKHDIGGLNTDSVYGKMCVNITVGCFHYNFAPLSVCFRHNHYILVLCGGKGGFVKKLLDKPVKAKYDIRQMQMNCICI